MLVPATSSHRSIAELTTNTNDMGVLARYQPLMADWDDFCQVIDQPLPSTFWRNPMRVSHEQLLDGLAAYDLSPQGYDFSDLAYQLPPGVALGRLLPWQAGWFHVQELVSMLAAPILAPQPGQRVLDLCAAPGGKTAMLAALMQQQGLLVANDLSVDRIKALRHVVGRMGMTNVLCTQSDARRFTADQPFDAVLADVPCSCEGTVRRNAKVRFAQAPRANICHNQAQILSRAVAALAPQGRLLYSTCTLAPEENEAQITALLAREPSMRLLPIDLAGIRHRPGLSHWQDQAFHHDCSLCWRLYPQDNNSGGFFLALLEKSL